MDTFFYGMGIIGITFGGAVFFLWLGFMLWDLGCELRRLFKEMWDA